MYTDHCDHSQKQSPRGAKIVFLELLQGHRKTIVLKSIFNEAACLMACNFMEKRLQHRRFPVSFAKFLRTSIF